jgi:hypothetical protein
MRFRSVYVDIIRVRRSVVDSGNFTVPGLTWQRARSLHLDQAFQARIAGNVYAQPLFWRTPGSTSGRLLVATEDNNVYALDATTGHLWCGLVLGLAQTVCRIAIVTMRYRCYSAVW